MKGRSKGEHHVAKIFYNPFAPRADAGLLDDQPRRWERLKRRRPEKARLIAEYTQKFLNDVEAEALDGEPVKRDGS